MKETEKSIVPFGVRFGDMMKETTFDTLPCDYQDLIRTAEQTMHHGYSPYSHFFVGAAVLTHNGKIFTGTNIETASYVAICAERAAIAQMVSAGVYQIKALALIATSAFYPVTELAGPCGICRQLLYEFSEIARYDIEIILSTTKKDRILVTTISELFPLSFGPTITRTDVSKYRDHSRTSNTQPDSPAHDNSSGGVPRSGQVPE